MAATLEELQALEEAIRLGARKVRYQDREVEYRDLAEVRSIRDEMRRELGLDSSKGTRRRVLRFFRGT